MWALLCCSCWFRLPLPLAGSKPAVTLTLALQICSVQQNLSLSLSHTYSAYSPAPIQASSFCFQYFSTLQHFSCVLGTTQGFNTLCKFNAVWCMLLLLLFKQTPKWWNLEREEWLHACWKQSQEWSKMQHKTHRSADVSFGLFCCC